MAQTVQLKRSALTGKVPDTGSLNLGELAVNTYDGKIYFKKSGSIESIESVLTTNSIVTGSIRLEGTASFGSLKVNDTLTVNHGETIISGSALVTSDLTILGQVNARQFNISVISSSVLFESGSSRFGNTLDDTHDFTGSVNVTGSLYLNGVAVATGSSVGNAGVFDFNLDPAAGTIGFITDSGSNYIVNATSTSVNIIGGVTPFVTITSQSFSTNTTFTASLQQGYTLVGNSSGTTYAVATSSIAGALPTGVVSGSSQVVSILNSLNTYTGSNDTTNTVQNTRLTTIESVTGSYETTGRGIVSGSSQITPLLPTGTVSGSIQVLGGTGIISSSTQLENATITNLTITNLTTVNETASVIFSSGSNRFGDFGDDTHSFTGSVKISGSITTIGSSTATSFNGSIAATNGVVSGSSQVDVMSTTNIARLATTGSNTFNGNVTVTNNNWLNFTDSTATARNILTLASNDNLYLQYKAGCNFYLRDTDGNLRLTTSSTGLFGLGTGTPVALLDVYDGFQSIYKGDSGVNTTGAGIFLSHYTPTRSNLSGAGIFSLRDNGDSNYHGLTFKIHNTATATDAAVTAVSIASTGTSTFNYDTSLQGNNYVNSGKMIQWEGGNYWSLRAVTSATEFQLYRGDTGATPLIMTTGNILRLSSLTGAGSRTVTADASGNLSASSDSSLKQEDTTHKIEGLAEILQLKPRAYKWLSDIKIRGEEATTEIGFFADEVNPIIPSAAPKGNDDLYGFYDRAVIAALVKSIQELKAENDTLKERLTAGGL